MKFGNLYSGVNLTKNTRWQAKMVYPVFLLERLFFVIIAYSLRNKTFFYRVFCLKFIKMGSLCYMLYERPLSVSRGVFAVNMFTEYIHVLFFSMMFLFTNYVTDPNVRFQLGWVAASLLMLNAIINFGLVIKEFFENRRAAKLLEKRKNFYEKKVKKAPATDQVPSNAESSALDS